MINMLYIYEWCLLGKIILFGLVFNGGTASDCLFNVDVDDLVWPKVANIKCNSFILKLHLPASCVLMMFRLSFHGITFVGRSTQLDYSLHTIGHDSHWLHKQHCPKG